MNPGDTRRSELDIHPVLNARFSNRAFSEREVSDAELELVLEAARWAPSSMNEQPWRFLVTRRGGEGHATLLAALNQSNQVWADKAPVLILAMVHRTLSRNGHENFHARHDLGLATAQFTAQATALGLGVHILGGFNSDMARESFNIPEELDVVSVLVLGFPGDPEQLSDNLKERELRRSERRPLELLVSYGAFGSK
ncbi:MAG TPA: nitroreductase family protein [Flavobacteriales bacterium]|nr:nitroreductase family protein [Flavobacteriales bacterium]